MSSAVDKNNSLNEPEDKKEDKKDEPKKEGEPAKWQSKIEKKDDDAKKEEKKDATGLLKDAAITALGGKDAPKDAPKDAKKEGDKDKDNKTTTEKTTVTDKDGVVVETEITNTKIRSTLPGNPNTNMVNNIIN